MSSEASPSPNNVEDDYNNASESDEASQLESSNDILVEDGCDRLEQEEEFEGHSVVETLRQLQALQRDRHRCAITGQISYYSFSSISKSDRSFFCPFDILLHAKGNIRDC